MTKVLLHTNDPEMALAIMAEAHPDLTPDICADYETLPARVAETGPEVVFSTRFSPAAFPRAALIESETVRWVQNAGSGCNHLAPWDGDRVTVTNAAGVAAEAMAQFAIGAMLHFSMDLPGMMADQAERFWRVRSVAPLAGRTLALVGLGKTGCRAAVLAKAMGMQTLGMRARPRPTEGVDEIFATADLHQALARADFVLVCLPLLDTTRGLIGAEALAALKPGAVLVDLSRGGIVVESALLTALDNGRVRGAALDVFETEPLPDDNPLWSHPRVLVSPHCSGVYDGWEAEAVRLFTRNLTRWRNGDPLENVVDPVRGY